MEFVYVYWTDVEGKHYTSSGLIAVKHFGAVEDTTHYNKNSYGIPIFNSKHGYLDDATIRKNIFEFINLAKSYPSTMFIFGHTPPITTIIKALLFHPANVLLDSTIIQLLESNIF